MHPSLRSFIAAAALAAAAAPLASAAEAGTWSVRLRATYLDMANKSDSFALGEATVPADAISVSDKTIPELDIAYWFTPHFAAELVLTIPQEHDVDLDGVGGLGTFKHLPPTLLAQYHFLPEATIQPYVGAGVNFTLILDADLAPGLDLEDYSVGLALQAGVDVKITEQVWLNLDVKKVDLGSDVTAGGDYLTKVELDPWLFSAGVGYRF